MRSKDLKIGNVSVLHQTLCHREIWQSAGAAPLILNCNTRWRWVVSF